jgi:TRAP-type C4-dicarboxylate transport system permease small subunit
MARPGARTTSARVLSSIINGLEVFASLVLAVMMLLTFVDVVGRYVLGKPIFGASEMISTLLALLIFAGLGIANARDQHIVVELFDDKFRRLAPGLYHFLIQGFSVGAMCLIAYVLLEKAVEVSHSGTKTIVLEWSLAAITGLIAALAILSVICQALGLMTGAATPKADPPEDL